MKSTITILEIYKKLFQPKALSRNIVSQLNNNFPVHIEI